MTGPTVIRCRARLTDDCYDGRAVATVYPDGIDDDYTWNGETVVCDACYIGLAPLTRSGKALVHELPSAIAQARRLLNAGGGS